MRKFFTHIYQNRLNSQAGVAALTAVIFAMVMLSAIGLNFLAETQQEQAGSALTYTSTNALMIAESGLRYAEKCLKKNLSGCPCYPNCNNTNWPNLVNAVYSSIAFGDTRGSFSFIVTSASTGVARVASTGTFAAAIRDMSKNVIAACVMQTNAITSCQAISTQNNATVSPPNSTTSGSCSLPALVSPTFPTGSTGCPNSSYPAFTGGSIASPYQYCSWNTTSGTVTIDTTTMTLRTNASLGTSQATFTNGSATVTLSSGSWPSDLTGERITANGSTWYTVSTVNSATQITLTGNYTGATTTSNYSLTSPVTIWVANNFTMSNSAMLDIRGKVTINVGGNALLQNNTATTVTNGSLTVQTVGNFNLKNNATMNWPIGVSVANVPSAANLLILVQGLGTLSNNIQFSGALYGPTVTFDLENNALFNGSVVAYSVTLQNNAAFTFDSTAGTSSSSYTVCTGGGSGTSQFTGG